VRSEISRSVNYPNMAAIYGVEHAGSTDALVIESAEGPTLADRIASGPIPHNANNGFRPMLSFTSEISGRPK